MKFKVKHFLLGVGVGILIPCIPYLTSQKGMAMKDKMKNKMLNVKDSFVEVVKDAKKNTASNMNEVLESINKKIDELNKSLSKIDVSKVKTKSKSS